jgi:hypothetical protein
VTVAVSAVDAHGGRLSGYVTVNAEIACAYHWTSNHCTFSEPNHHDVRLAVFEFLNIRDATAATSSSDYVIGIIQIPMPSIERIPA